MKRLAILLTLALLLGLDLSIAQAQEELVCESDVIVQEGDWLSIIAEQAYGDPTLYEAIAAATNLKAQSDSSYATIDSFDVIEPGWKLCIPSQAEAGEVEVMTSGDAGAITEDELANASYSGIYEEPVTLTEGLYEGEPFSADSPTRPTVTLVNNGGIFGNLDGDGVEDAAVFLVENSGGTGHFTYVSAQLNQNGQPVDAGAVLVGDSTQVKSAAIENGQIVAEFVTQGPEDAQCCPTLKVRKSYALQEGQLAEVGSEDLERISAADLNGTSWTLLELNTDQPALAETAVTISFADGQITGSGGCNNYNSSFSLGEDNPSAMMVAPIAATRKACPDPILNQETAYFTALENVSQWGYLIGHLALYYQNDQGGLGTLLFAPQAAVAETTPIELLTATTWQWLRLTDPQQQIEVASPENYTLTFLADGMIQMQADCNSATASYIATEAGALTITPGITTLVACPPESRSEEFMQKLGFAAIYFFQDGNLFIDLMADGGTLEFSPQGMASQAGDEGVTATEVITFIPAEIPTESQAGSCFTNAIGLGRADTYRCTVGNAIFDPCFAVGDAPTVVCDANPASGETGFVLELTEPLPAPDVGQLSQPWLVELADGQVCGLMTGTVPGVGERIAPYGCPDGSNLFDDFQPGELWMTEKAVIGLNENGFFVEQSEMVVISRVWR